MKRTAIKGKIGARPAERLGSVRMRVIPEAAALGVTFMLESLPPRSSAPRVTHERTGELTCVIRGRMTARAGGRTYELSKGDYLLLPPGTPHRFETGERGVEAISVFSPPLDMGAPDARIVFVKNKPGARK